MNANFGWLNEIFTKEIEGKFGNSISNASTFRKCPCRWSNGIKIDKVLSTLNLVSSEKFIIWKLSLGKIIYILLVFIQNVLSMNFFFYEMSCLSK